MAINPMNPPKRVEPGDADFEYLYLNWQKDGQPRNFSTDGIVWRQITDNVGVVFIVDRPVEGSGYYYDQSSYQKVMGS